MPAQPQAAGKLRNWLIREGPFLVFFLWMILKQRFALGAIGLAPGPYMLWASIASLLALLPWVRLLKGRWQIAGMLLADGLVTVLNFADLLYFRQFGDLVSAATVRFAAQLAGVPGSVTALVATRDLLLFADLPVIALLGLLLVRRTRPAFAQIRLRTAALTALAGIAVVVGMFFLDPVMEHKYYGHTMVGSRLGLVSYHAVDTGAYMGRLAKRLTPSTVAVAEIRTWFEGRRGAPKSPLAGVARGKNVIVIQIESFQNFPIGLQVGGQEVTPHLNRLAGESLYFSNFFSQTGQGVTSDADLLGNCSLYPTRTGAVYYDYAANDFRCMPALLREHGYKAVAAQGMPADFWNLGTVYPRIGFEQYFSLKDHQFDEKLGIGLGDDSFLRQNGERLTTLPEPFYAFLSTLTSHGPFDFAGMPKTLQLGELEGTKAGHYLHAVHYTDGAIGKFVAQLKATGMLDRSVLVVYGDHVGVYRNSDGMADLLGRPADDRAFWMATEKQVPLLIRLPGGAHAGEQRHTAGQADIAPTVAALAGVDTDTAYFMGRNLLEQPRGTVAFYDGSAADDHHLFVAPDADSVTGTCLDRATGASVETVLCEGLAAKAQRELEISQKIVERNLLKELLGK